MNWFSNLFKKKSPEVSESDNKWFEGFRSFEKGMEFYLNENTNEALQHFDNAINNGYERDVYDFRAGCLQQMNYDYDAIEDFNKAISLSPNDCNKYYCRSISKGAILDFEGQIADLEKAIELSKEDNKLNTAYRDGYKKNGGENDFAFMFRIDLVRAKMDLDSELKDKEMIENATSPEQKAELQKMSDEWRAKRLKRILKRVSLAVLSL